MTLKTSSSNLRLIFAVMKRNLWLLVLAVIGFIFSMPVATAISTQRRGLLTDGFSSEQALAEALRNGVDNMCAIFYNCSAVIVVMGAVLAGVVLFHYLTRSQQVDLFHSLPLKRGRLFAIRYCAGFLLFLLPFLLGVLLNACVVAGLGYGGVFPWGEYTLLALRLVLSFFCLYSMMVFAMMLSGTSVMALLLMIAMNFLGPLVLLLRRSLYLQFFQTFWAPFYDGKTAYIYSSPVINTFTGDLRLLNCLILLVAGLAALALAVLCYQRRKSEAAGKSLVFRWTKPIVRLPLAFLGTVCFAYLFYTIGNNSLPWLFFGAVTGAVLISQFLQIWIEQEFAAVKRGWIGVVLVAVLSCGFFGYLAGDWGGYDTYLPETADVDSVLLEINGLNDYSYPGYGYISDEASNLLEPRRIRISDPAAVEAVLAVARQGIARNSADEETASRTTADSFGSLSEEIVLDTNDPAEQNYVSVGIVYNPDETGNGKARLYSSLPVSEIQEQLITILNDSQYQESYSGVNHLPAQQIFVDGVDNFKANSIDLDGAAALDDADQRRLVEAYQKDYRQLTGETMRDEIPIGQISLLLFTDARQTPDTIAEAVDIYENDADYQIPFYEGAYPVYSSFTNTIAVVEELFGADFFGDSLEHINSIEVYYQGTGGIDVDAAVENSALYQRYLNSPEARETMTFEEFEESVSGQLAESITDPAAIREVMTQTADVNALSYTPFHKVDTSVSYVVVYDDFSTGERALLID